MASGGDGDRRFLPGGGGDRRFLQGSGGGDRRFLKGVVGAGDLGPDDRGGGAGAFLSTRKTPPDESGSSAIS